MSTVLTLGFPVYAVEACEETSRVIIAGGGGPAKSGVRNAIISYRIQEEGSLEVVSEVSCGSEAPMCLHLFNSGVVCGVNDRCWVLINDSEDEDSSTQADFAVGNEDSYLRHVTTGSIVNGERLITSGSDGYIRYWNIPSLDLIWEMKISDGRVDSIDFFGSFLVIVTSSACHLYMMNCDEKQTPKFSKKIEGKSLRAARILGDSGVLLVVENASPGNRTGFISSYKISIKTEDSVIETNLIQRKPLPRDLRVSCLCVSSNDLVGIGGSSGEVLVLNISNLQKKFLDRCSHSFIVTSIRILQFGESKKKTCVISGSGDGTVRIAPLIKARNFEDFFYYIINMVAILTLIIALALLIPHQISADIL